MRGYILVDVNIKDMEMFKEYVEKVSALLEKYDGKYIVKGAVPSVVRLGEETPQYVVVIEFPSVDKADSFIGERNVLGLADLFNRATSGRILRVEACS